MNMDFDMRMELNEDEKAKLREFAVFMEHPEKLPPGREIEDYLNSLPFMVQHKFRDAYINRYGFVLPCKEMLEGIASLNTPIVSVGAGLGYIEKILQKQGVEVVLTDIHPVHHGNNKYQSLGKEGLINTDVQEMDAITAVNTYRDHAVLMAWPNYNSSWAYELAQELKSGRTLIYIGEWNGCTACDNFHDYVEVEFEELKEIFIPQFPGIHDVCWIYRKK